MGGEPKQFRPIAGVPMLLRSIRPFAVHPSVLEIVVALPPLVAAAPPEWLADLVGDRLKLVSGGATRADSVLAALQALNPACGVVLVHDAARPFVSADTIDAVIELATEVGVVPAVPVSDTIKRVAGDSGRIVETVDRRGLWRAQTPQGFPRKMLEQAYARLRDAGAGAYTDESSLAEASGFTVRVVSDDPGNIKITTSSDLSVAELMADQ